MWHEFLKYNDNIKSHPYKFEYVKTSFACLHSSYFVFIGLHLILTPSFIEAKKTKQSILYFVCFKIVYTPSVFIYEMFLYFLEMKVLSSIDIHGVQKMHS